LAKGNKNRSKETKKKMQVKPGYKKKMRLEKEKRERRERRKKIENIYRKKNN
jgi:ATP-dependent RNA helicase DeaD